MNRAPSKFFANICGELTTLVTVAPLSGTRCQLGTRQSARRLENMTAMGAMF